MPKPMSLAARLGLRPPKAGGRPPPMPTVPPVPRPRPFVNGTIPADAFTAVHGALPIITAGAGQQAFGRGANPVVPSSAVVSGDRFYYPQYTPLSQVALPDYDASHRDWRNLHHPPAPTSDEAPRPDWIPWLTQNWPLKAFSGLKHSLLG